MNELHDEIARLTKERDTARRIAVSLEQELAEVTNPLRLPTATIRPGRATYRVEDGMGIWTWPVEPARSALEGQYVPPASNEAGL